MKIHHFFSLSMAVALGLGLSSCINEYPQPERCIYKINLNVRSETTWLPVSDITSTKSDGLQIKYQFEVYASGTVSQPVLEKTVYSSDFDRKDFYVDLDLHVGSYDVYVWSDVCATSTGESLFYDSVDFAGIEYKTPYKGDTDYKDAFRGMISFSIDHTMFGKTIEQEIILTRPLARYMLIATDLQDYLGAKAREGSGETVSNAIFADYSAEVSYPLYMPSVFNNFTNKPMDSWSGVSFSGGIVQAGEDRVMVGMDYVMINGGESNVQVALEIKDENGTAISRTGTLNIPLLRDRTTIVYGKFLTTSGNGEIVLDPNFKGEYNLEIN